MKWLILLSLIACAQFGVKTAERVPAEEASNYRACHEIREELLVTPVNYEGLPLTFKEVKQNVFQNHCASCHFGSAGYKPQLDSYEATVEYVTPGRPEESRLVHTIDQGKMPPSSDLRERDEKAYRFMKAWIAAGALP